MVKELWDKGLAVRKEVLGAEYVERNVKAADDFSMPMQEYTTEACWGWLWTRPPFPRAWRRSGSPARRCRNTSRVRKAAKPRSAAALVAVEEQDLLEALGVPDRTLRAIEEDVEKHVVDIVVPPHPDLFVARRKVPGLPGPAEQPEHVVAHHPGLHHGEIRLAPRLVDFLHPLVGSHGDHEALHRVVALGVLP